MAFNPRKLLPDDKIKCDYGILCNKLKTPPGICDESCVGIKPCNNICRRLPPPPPISPISGVRNHHLLRTSMYFMVCLIGSALLCAIVLTIVRVYYYKRNNRRREAMFLNTHEDFVDENRGPEIDNPFWHIQFVGLPESVIESISMIRYEKGLGLVEGTDCSVCLSEFEEGESLRLLPKCSHAFHVPCIDTWLRSHKTCPMCRAAVVSDVNVANVARVGISLPEVNANDTGSSGEGDSENYESRVDDDFGNDGNRDGDSVTLSIEDENAARSSSGSRICGSDFWVSSDLAGDKQVVIEEDMQPIRRSVSLDSPSAMMIQNAVSGLRQSEHLGNSESNLVKVIDTNSNIVSKQDGGSSSKCSMKKSWSVGSSLSKGSIPVKRSVSSGGKFLFFRYSRSQDMILPM